MLPEINSIKTVARAEMIFNALFASYVQQVGEKQAIHSDKMVQRFATYKVNGLAWWKARIRAVAWSLVTKESRVSHFIPPSPETEAWTSFGGEHVSYTDKKKESAAIEFISDRIRAL